MTGMIGRAVSRVDGRAKVTGQARYAAEFELPGLAHAALVAATIPRGRVVALDTAGAERAEGVIAVISHHNAPRLPYLDFEERPVVDPKTGEQIHVFQDDAVRFNGQPIAVVVAETLEQARHAASLVRSSYESLPALTTFDAERSEAPSEAWARAGRGGGTHRGDADRAYAESLVKVDETYSHPREQHNAMELHATVAAWDGDRLTLYDKTQWVDNDRAEIALVFGIPESHIRVIAPFVGGAFGSALRTWPHVTVAALAARMVQRPVRLELSRREQYYHTGFRPHTEQRVRLAARRDGTLTAIIHEAVQQTSTYEQYAERTLEPPRMSYACANVRTRYRLVEMNTNTPSAMRAPGLVSGNFALEVAMDELAVALGMDPVELRLRNYAEQDEHRERPWSSKALRDCYYHAAGRFGWERRSPAPGSMRDGRLRVGYGMATAVYPAERSRAAASATLFADATAVVRSAASDIGPGTYTSMTQIAAETLQLPLESVRFELGDSDMPYAPQQGGSITMASVGSAVQAACLAARGKVAALAAEPVGAPVAGGAAAPDPATVTRLAAELGNGAACAAELRAHGLDRIEAGADVEPGEEAKEWSSYGFGAVYAEVRVDPELGLVRVRRVVGAYDAGRIINERTTHSQCIGGIVGGIGMALLEQADWDARFGRVMNANLAEYLVPVNPDVPDAEAMFVRGDDRRFSPIGAKGIAELGIVGVPAAIANAVYHATGTRVRHLPITPEQLLAPL